MNKIDEYYLIPETITSISINAFTGNNHLESIVIHDKVITLKEKSISYMNSLKTVLFETKTASGLTCGSDPFISNEKLQNITIRDDFEGEDLCNTETPLNKTAGISIGVNVCKLYVSN